MNQEQYNKLAPSMRKHLDSWRDAQANGKNYMEVPRARDTSSTVLAAMWQELPVPHQVFRCGEKVYVGTDAPRAGCSGMLVPDTDDYSGDLDELANFIVHGIRSREWNANNKISLMSGLSKWLRELFI